MVRRQPRSARRVRTAVTLGVLAAACLAHDARGTEIGIVRWFSDAAAPALRAAAPANDPMLAGRELLDRGLTGAFAQVQRVGPAWLARVRLDVSFAPGFHPSYALTATQPLLASARHDAALDLHGDVHHTGDRTGGDFGLRYRARWRDRDVTLGVQGGVEDRWLEELQRYRFGTELRLSSIEVRANLYDDVPAHPASRHIAERRLDGYDLGLAAPVPFVSWASLRACRSWQVAVDGETVSPGDRVGFLLTPLSALEIEAGTQSHAGDRSWFTQLRWRIKLGA